LTHGEITIYKQGLEKMFLKNLSDGRVKFTTDLKSGIHGAQIVFLALPTPPGEDGSAN
jgi:UDPglucose 6-dehydrogenase